MKQSNYKIAITGGIGSGKSTVAKMIEELGYKVISADETYAELCNDSAFLKELCKKFGNILNGSGGLDRAKLSEIVFKDEEKLKQLNEFSHPEVYKKMFEKTEQTETKTGGICFFEVPLLFEDGYEGHFDQVIVVKRNINDRIESVIKRSNLNKSQVVDRINSQYNYESNDFAKYYVIHNNKNFVGLKQDVLSVIDKINKEFS